MPPPGILAGMSTLAEIEAAAEALSASEKEQLFHSLAVAIRRERALPAVRIYSDAEVAAMLAEDEVDGSCFRAGN